MTPHLTQKLTALQNYTKPSHPTILTIKGYNLRCRKRTSTYHLTTFAVANVKNYDEGNVTNDVLILNLKTYIIFIMNGLG